MKSNKKIEALLKKKRKVTDKIRARNDITTAKRTRLTDKYEADINKLLAEANKVLDPLKRQEIALNAELIKAGYNPFTYVSQEVCQ